MDSLESDVTTPEPALLMILHVSGSNRPGLVGRLFSAVAEHDVRPRESVGHTLGGQAHIATVLEGQNEKQLQDAKAAAKTEFARDEINVKGHLIGAAYENPSGSYPWQLRVIAPSHSSSLSDVARFLQKAGIDIISFHDESYKPPRTGEMMTIQTYVIRIPKDDSYIILESDLRDYLAEQSEQGTEPVFRISLDPY